MKIILIMLLVSTSVFAEKNCKKEAIALKVIDSMTSMVEDPSGQSCADFAEIMDSETKHYNSVVPCKGQLANPYESVTCDRPKELINEVIKDVEEVPYKKICQIYLPKMQELKKKCKN